MKVLLDECRPTDFRHELRGYEVFTVSYQGWIGLKNGKLLATAIAHGFDAMVATDGSIPFQQNLASMPIALIILESASNDISDLLPLVPNLRNALATLTPRTIQYVLI